MPQCLTDIPLFQVIGLSKLNKKQSQLDQLKNVFLRDSCVVGDSPPVGAAQGLIWLLEL